MPTSLRYDVIPADKKPNVQKLKTALKDASEVLLATDPYWEGESISWHLTEVLKPKIPVRRIEFHEITEEAVNDALKHARDINESLVRAQESRRIIDRLVRLLTLAGAVEEGADRSERRARAERGGPADCRA